MHTLLAVQGPALDAYIITHYDEHMVSENFLLQTEIWIPLNCAQFELKVSQTLNSVPAIFLRFTWNFNKILLKISLMFTF